jgi:hypothetical protein
MAAFKQKFAHAEELGMGLCTMSRCTQPFLLAAGVQPADASTHTENWTPVLQEIPLDTPVLPGSLFFMIGFKFFWFRLMAWTSAE